MVKRLLLLIGILFFFQITVVFSQITIGTVDAGPYTPGSTIAATFNLGSTSCIRPGSKFELFLSDANGSFASEVKIGEFNSFYSTFVNGTIPPGTVAGTGYRVRVKSTNPALISGQSAAFEIRVGTPVTAQVRSSPSIGTDMFGFCPGRNNQAFNFTNESTTTSSVTGTVTNELTSTVVSNLTFIPPTQPQSFTASLAHYTVFIKAQMPDGSVATRAYMVVNNNVFNSFSTTGSNVVCLPGGYLQYGVDISSTGILNNYPGNTYQIIWGDNVTDTYTFCDLKTGFVRHEYLTPSCGNPPYNTGGQTIYNVFGINISVVSPCGPVGGALSTYVRVVTKPENRFTSPVAACTNTLVTFTNNSIAGQDPGANTPACTDNNVRYNWYVNNVLMLADVPRTTNFTHTFPTHGIYDIKLESVTSGVCEGVPITHQICIQDRPQPAFDFGGVPQTGCAPFVIQALDHSIIDNICNTNNTYNWIVSPSQGVQFNPTDKNPVFTFSNPGTYSIILEIQTASCGAVRTQIPQKIVLADGDPTAVLSPDVTLCALNTLAFNTLNGPTRTVFSGTQVDLPDTYTWKVTAPDGSPLDPVNDYSFANGSNTNTKYPSIQFKKFIAYKVSVIHKNSCRFVEASQVITFSPAPVPTIDPVPNICYNDAVTLNATVSGGSYVDYVWSSAGDGVFTNVNTLTPTYTPGPGERGLLKATVTLTLNTGIAGSCKFVPVSVDININPNNTGTNTVQKICTGDRATLTLTSSVPASTFTWTATNADGNAQGFTPSGTANINDAITNTHPTQNAVVLYTITPKANGCTGVPFTFEVTVNPKPVLTATALNGTICSNQQAGITMSSNLPAPPATSYRWTSTVTGSVTGNTNSAATTNTAINDLLINNGTTQGSVTYTITAISSNGCPGTPVDVTILVDPALTVPNAGADESICNLTTYTLKGNPITVGLGTWTLTSGQTGVVLVNPNLATTAVTGLVGGQTYTFQWRVTSTGACAALSDEVSIVVNTPTVPGTTATADPATVCAANNSGNITLSGNVGSVTRWESSIDGGTNWSPITNTTTTLTYTNITTTTQFRAVVQNGQCAPEFSTATVITVSSATTTANAGVDQTLCNQAGTTLDADATLKPGETGRWTVTSATPNAIITDPTNPKSTVTGLTSGQTYRFTWTITGNSPCGITADEVVVQNNPPINQSITSASSVVCNGQQVLIDGSVPTGGNGNYVYVWESKTGTGLWTTIQGETSEDLTITLTTTGDISFRRIVTSGGCTSTSNEFQITVQPPIAGNTIAANQTICSGTAPLILTGSIPSGGDGQYIYQWQSSPDGTTWTSIPGALLQNYQAPVLTGTTFYRRAVSTVACSGSLQSASNVVKITVNPNARAEFTWGATDKGCAPFSLPITAVPYADRNATYTWYANNSIIGTGITFPGYTILNSNQSVTIKLVVTSSLGCSTDEFSHDFSTNQAVPASFTPVATTDCGPLTVNFVNQSIQTAGATFRWNFGNGQTSNNANPLPVTFQEDPSGKDTTYTVTLYSITTCGTDSAKGTVLVKARPKPVFSPSRTTGCSPLLVNFTNNSPRQSGIEYFFNFGDGSPVVRTTDRSSVVHTYRTTTNVQTFIATMTAVNLCGTATSVPYTIVVSPNTVNAELVVNGNQKRGCAPFKVTFDNNSTGATDFSIDFKDGTQPRLSITSPERFDYTFTAAGVYDVTLIASNGCSRDTTVETITVLAQPTPAFQANNTLGCPGLQVQFRNTTQDANIISFVWNLGDGTPAFTGFEPPLHTYTGNQEYYTVTLTATNALGCSNTITQTQYIHIVQPPVAAFNVNPSTLISIPDYTFRFEDESTNNPTIWEWDFGDGVGSSLKNPSHTYPDTGTYKVTLKVINQQGCYTTTFKNVTIKGVPGYLFVPNSFVPGNTRPELRTFKAKGSGLQSWRFSVFNKWGQVLWETTKLEEGRPAEGWDGTFKGQDLPQGVYYWKVDVQMINGSEWKGMTYDKSAPKRTGAIHLIR